MICTKKRNTQPLQFLVQVLSEVSNVNHFNSKTCLNKIRFCTTTNDLLRYFTSLWIIPTIKVKVRYRFLISNFCCVLNVVFFLLCDYLASEFYMPMFWNTPSVPLGSVIWKNNPNVVQFFLATYYWPPLGVFALNSLFLYLDTPPHRTSFKLAQVIFEPNL